MNLVLQDIEDAYMGFKEIDRKRELITRIIRSVIVLIEGAKINWKWEEIVIEVSLCSYGTFYLLGGKKGNVNVHFSKNDLMWDNYANSVPSEAIPALYSVLPDIINSAEMKVPEAGIAKTFKFFIQHGKKISKS